MRKAIGSLLLLLFISCNQGDTITSPSKTVPVFLDFSTGFKGDSVVVICDGTLRWTSLAYSDSLNVVGGVVFSTTEGANWLTLKLPLDNIRSSILFVASDSPWTDIGAHFDRTHRVISYEIRRF